jgi:hypothetical protein
MMADFELHLINATADCLIGRALIRNGLSQILVAGSTNDYRVDRAGVGGGLGAIFFVVGDLALV